MPSALTLKSIPAVAPVSVPCGTPFSHLISITNPKLPATLVITWSDGTTSPCPITWEFGKYDPWDNIGAVVTLKGTVAFPAQDSAGNTYSNPNNLSASCAVTTTVVVAPPPIPPTKDQFCRTPGQETGPGNQQP